MMVNECYERHDDAYVLLFSAVLAPHKVLLLLGHAVVGSSSRSSTCVAIIVRLRLRFNVIISCKFY